MPNNITGNPWYIDTVGTIFTSKVYINSLKWFSPAVGSQCKITDLQGRIIVNLVANASDPSMDLGSYKWVEGFVVVTLGSGNLTVIIHK